MQIDIQMQNLKFSGILSTGYNLSYTYAYNSQQIANIADASYRADHSGGTRTKTGKFTAYISPYMVVSNGGNYSKHIYMGSQRIVSKLSNSGGLYFYHPEHLGSSSLITDGTGALTQHIQYVPFGEVFVEERTNSRSTPYKFNGKELDEETGLYYYHARYYDPRLSVWLSVDPLAEKKPWMTSYHYCSNNPVMRIDPDGRDDIFDDTGAFITRINNGTDYVQVATSEGGMKKITDFSYSVSESANREMLINISSHYGVQAGINDQIGLYDLRQNQPADGFAVTLPTNRKVCIALMNGQLHADAGNAYNLINAFVHEDVHKIDGRLGSEAELNAIRVQSSHSSWVKTTESFKSGVKNYAVSNVTKYFVENPGHNENNVPHISAINKNILPAEIYIFNRSASISFPIEVLGTKSK